MTSRKCAALCDDVADRAGKGHFSALGKAQRKLHGALDIPFYRGEASHNAFAAAYSAATFEMIDDAGHYSMLETPVRVASIIEKQMAAAG